MEYTIQEIQAMLNIVSALLKNRRFQQGNALRISTVYNIDDFDIATMEKWIAYWKKQLMQQNRLKLNDNMKNNLSNFTTKCLIFNRFFSYKQGVTTHEVEDSEQDMFSGTVYINRHEIICVEKENDKYMVYINNPDGHDGEQWVFGYYEDFELAIQTMDVIINRGEYPQPLEIW